MRKLKACSFSSLLAFSNSLLDASSSTSRWTAAPPMDDDAENVDDGDDKRKDIDGRDDTVLCVPSVLSASDEFSVSFPHLSPFNGVG